MPRINVERVLEKLEYELKMALKKAVEATAPDKGVDYQILFKEFKKQAVKNCRQWENIESNAVDTD